MNWKHILWSVIKAVFRLLLKLAVICFYILSSLLEVILRNINEYIKRRL